MKRWSQIAVAAGLFIALVVMPAYAQETTEETTSALMGAIVQQAASGALVDNEDGTYTLTLAGISPFSAWFLSAPDFAAGQNDSLAFAEEWAAAPEGLTAVGLLAFAEDPDVATIDLTLSTPVYDPENGSVTYIVTIEGFTLFDLEVNTDKVEAPAEFTGATLFIVLDDAFGEGWSAGAAARAEGTRDSSQGCHGRPRCN